MLEEFAGLPTHPLAVHAAVVFVPLLVLAGIGYAVVPRLRTRLGWVAALLAVIAPLTALVAKLSGERLAAALAASNYPPQVLNQVAEHQEYGDRVFWFSLGSGAATLLLVLVTSGRLGVRRRRTAVRRGLIGLVVILGALTAIYAYLTGESGARTVWSGVL